MSWSGHEGTPGPRGISRILISPYSKKLRNNKKNPKNYPFWQDLVKILTDKGCTLIQISLKGEKRIPGIQDLRLDLQLGEIKNLLNEVDTWISVDNFFPHFANMHKKSGIVLWGKSDPNIFGYPENKNLLKDRKFLRSNQFDIWENEEYDSEVFVSPETVVKQIYE